jgi:signal transduction histidine kinase
MSSDTAPNLEREQTDESLRVEREIVDDALAEELAEIDETADAVIARARRRADRVLAAARAKTDQQVFSAPPAVAPLAAVAKERLREDQVLLEERAIADEVLREERAEHVALLTQEREETDNDLSRERAQSDEVLATRDEFLGTVSHELRNMLTGLMGFAALIADKAAHAEHADEVRRYANRIQRSGARMDRLIGDLLDVVSIQSGRLAVTPELGDPAAVVREALESFQPQASVIGVSLGVDIPVTSSKLRFDPARILQVLTNMLSNAVKFTPRGGSIVVRVEHAGDEVRFAVSDTGAGIPADKLEAIFGRFHQVSKNDRRGAGLGLYISKCIVQGHGGRIWAESEVGKGSTFYFTLPSPRPGAN